MSDYVHVSDPASKQEAMQRIREIASRQAAVAARMDQERQAKIAVEEAERQAHLDALAEQAREAVAAAIPEEVRARDPRRIMQRIARRHGLTLGDITGPSRLRPIVRARWAAIDAVRAANPAMSSAQMGRHFGNRDHTTILNAIAQMAREGVPQPPAGVNAGDAR